MVFGRKLLPSWSSSRSVETGPDLDIKTRAQMLEAMHKTLLEVQLSMQVYLANWQAMCQASRAIAEGLEKLANGASGGSEGRDGEGVNADSKTKKGVASLVDTARVYNSAQRTIDRLIREPTQRVVEDTTLRKTGALLSRFPPIFGKIAKRKQLLAEVEAAKSKVRTAEAAKDKERDSFSVVAGAENRRQVAAALATAISVADGVKAEVLADADRLERERGTMLVPQVSALVGCQAYFMRRSAAVLERLAEQLPYSALALCRLVRPHALEAVPASRRRRHPPPPPPPRPAPKAIDYTSSSSTIYVDVSAHSLDSPLPEPDGGGRCESVSGSSTTSLASSRQQQHHQQHQHQHQHQHTTTTGPAAPCFLDLPVNDKPEQAGRSSSAGLPRASSPPPPPPRPAAAAVGTRRHSNPFASAAGPQTTSAGAGAGAGAARSASTGVSRPVFGAVAAAPSAPLVEPRTEAGVVVEVAVQEWAVTGKDNHGDVGGP